MASKNDRIGDFFELRHGFEALSAFASAALDFLDLHGIALTARSHRAPGSNGASPTPSQTLREKVKRHYTARRVAATNGHSAPKQAAKKTAASSYADKRLAARAHSASLLARLDRIEPRPVENAADRIHMGSLIRRGYAKKKGGGYVLTAKGEKGYRTDLKKGPAAAASDSDADAGTDITVKEAAQILGMSDSNVRLMIKAGKIAGRADFRAREGFAKPVKTIVLDREEVERYATEINT